MPPPDLSPVSQMAANVYLEPANRSPGWAAEGSVRLERVRVAVTVKN
jgi:hypothetical protein